MLTQMVWFYFARMFNLEAQLGSWKIAALVDVAVCVSVGCLFFALDNISRKGLSRLVKVVRK